MVEKGSLHKISVMSVGRQGKDKARQLEHIVNVAAFAGSAINLKSQFLGCTKILVHPVAAGGVAVMIGHYVPEKARGHQICRLAGIKVADGSSDHLGNLSVAVGAGQNVFMMSQRPVENFLLKLAVELKPAAVTGISIEVS